VDAGDVAEHVGLDAEAIHGRLQAQVDVDRAERIRGVDVR
jgi:hypothetical protein